MPKTFEAQPLLLDTHIWLWVVAGSTELSASARQAIDKAGAQGALRIAAISLWEIALLASRGRIVLGKSISLWLDERWPSPARQSNPSISKSRSKATRYRKYFIRTRPTA
jgi:PIN domain nuclease of toxin-antitoxin system